MPPRSSRITPVPYKPGKSLQLQVLGSWCSPPLPEYFIRQGESDVFLRSFEEEKRTALIPPSASHLYDGTLKGIAKYEAALWQECSDYFDCETEAYERLKAIQGNSIPRMYAHVCLAPQSSDTVPLDLIQSPHTARYLVRGVLLELVPGSAMWDLAISPLSSFDPKMWQAVVQSAADAAHDINQRGIIIEDCGPRNVVVEEHSQKPFIIDLAQCGFKDKLIKAWEEFRDENEDDTNKEDGEDKADEEDEDWDPETEYWRRVRSSDNTGAIGSVMATLLLKERGITLDIKYPDREN